MALQHRSPKITDLFSIFILDQRMRGHTARTVGIYEERLGRFIDWLTAVGIIYVGQITPSHIRSYLVTMQERGLAGYTVVGAARSIRALFQLCRTRGDDRSFAHGEDPNA